MRRKIIKALGFIILSNVPLITMATSSSTTSSSETLISQINQTFKTKLRTKFVNSWVTETKESSNSNISNGYWGSIFEDSRGNLWAMGRGTPLQKYDYNNKKWVGSSKSNITNGEGGVIFEDSRGNLWSMGKGAKLQRYDYDINRWEFVNGNNINDGEGGMIFEDSRGNLWAMGNRTKLQKYDYNTKIWSIAAENSNISNGYWGTIFEDSRGNLWAMGSGTPLQKYDYDIKQWDRSNKSNINGGSGGVIFEDSKGNLWAMGFPTSLQKYDYNNKQWDNSIGSNINNGSGGVIFEDSQGNLWSMGNTTPLQKYDYNNKQWNNSSGSNINNGYEGTIIEDSRGNLWSIGKKTKLQKYNFKTKNWSNDSNSNITDGQGVMMFEDSRGNLWAMGNGTPLQKLTSQVVPNINDQKIKNFDITFKTRINADGRIAVLIKGYRKYTSDKFTHLKYKKKNEPTWKIVKDKIMILNKVDYEFKWVIGADEHITSDSKMPVSFDIKNDGSIKKNIITTNLRKELFFVIGTNGNGNIRIKSNDLSPQVEVKYYIGLTLSSNNSDYSSKIPNKLSNGKKVWIKFFIKDQNINTHKFPDNFANTPIEIKVSGLNNKSSNKESSGTAIGIIVGSIVGTLTLGILAYYLIRLKRKKTK